MNASIKKVSRSEADVSVVIPAYNCARTISAALESVQQQTLMPREIVVVNDGSTDDTESVLKTLSNEFPNLRCIGQTNGGPAAARNKGIDHAKGTWVAFLDSDDAWKPNKLESQFALIPNSQDLHWIAGSYDLHVASADGLQKVAASSITSEMKRSGDGVYDGLKLLSESSCIWTGTVVALRKSLLELDGFATDLFGCEDSDLWRRMARRHRNIGYVTSPVADYTVAQSASITATNGKAVEPSQFTHYARIIADANSSDDPEERRMLENIAMQKINGYMTCLIRSGNTNQARWFISELKRRNLPTAKTRHRLASLIPGVFLRSLKTVKKHF